MSPVIVWFRQDLRLSDNPALCRAAESGLPVVCLYILDEANGGVWAPGGASRWWLGNSLTALGSDLRKLGGELVLRRGDAATILKSLVGKTKAQMVVWNRCYEPFAIERDRNLKGVLLRDGLEVESFNASLLHEPWTVKNAENRHYRVFTPFWRALRARGEPQVPLVAPRQIRFARNACTSEDLDSWGLLPRKPDWAHGLRAEWTPGEAGGQGRLNDFLARLPNYPTDRDRPDLRGSSRLSPHLHWGEISPRQIWYAVAQQGDVLHGAEKFLSELAWREFSYHLLFHHPAMPTAPLDSRFERFEWAQDEAAVSAWTRGRTGIPIVDAGMRELWTTGWMHNRVRMIAASFLVKHLGIDWRRGEAWFWDTLVDADLANNAQGWQWVTGCGADAAPFFRIFNPVLQGKKFDPEGNYVRRWVPELAHLPANAIHAPWELNAGRLREAGIVLGQTYPERLIDLAEGRSRALHNYRAISG